MKKILILASNPRKDLDLKYEIHTLRNIIEGCRERQGFNVIIDSAISPQNIQKLFLQHRPRIVHFCGHGTGEKGLVLEDSTKKEQIISTKALTNLFGEFTDTVECVLLNACYSEVQAEAIVQHINYAIGMNQSIRDDAAILFAKGFYQALGYGRTIQQCYRLAKNTIELELSEPSEQKRKFEVVNETNSIQISEHLKPTIKVKFELTLFPEDVARQKYISENQEDFHLGKRTKSSLSQQERRHRQVLLNKVKDFWIKGVLENSIHTKALLELKIQGKPDLVSRPFSEYEELPVDPNASYEWLQATDIFERMGDGRTLLILGEPGAGKTITLLKLARRFIEKANKNLSLPIPVVVNLSSWANRPKPIDKWLVEELKEKYQVSKSLSKSWIEQEQLLLLLDGLDEVKAERRNACVIALNKFLNTHGLTELVVCSRFKDYEALSERLQLRSAVYIQPLISEHINWYLKDAGEQLSGLKTLLYQDAEIEEFAKTPLILSIMSLTYQNCSLDDVMQQLSSSDRYTNLFNSYIERMFQRRKSRQQYSTMQVTTWLIWLAQRMSQASQTVFFIERIQPLWLPIPSEKILYQLVTFLMGLLMGGVIGGGIGSLVNQSLLGLIIGGLSAGLPLVWRMAEIQTVETLTWSWQEAKQFLKNSLLKGLPLGMLVGLAMKKPVLGLLYGIIGGLILEVLGGLRGPEIETKSSPNQGIWNSAKNAAILGAIGGLVGILMGGFVGEIIDQQSWWNLGLVYGLVVGLVFGGGAACLRHFNLRLILSIDRYAPHNYAGFLDYTTDLLFMQKVGGGYIFVHRMLLEHFARMKFD